MSVGRTIRWLLVAVALLVTAPAAPAQVNSNIAPVNLNAVLTPRLTVVASPATVNFAMLPGTVGQGDSPITIQSRWVLPIFTYIFTDCWAYFTVPGAALTNGAGNNIPAARVRGSVNGGAYNAFTNASPFSAASLRIYRVNTFFLNRNVQRTDTLALQIDTTGLGLPAGTYTGVLVIQARAL
jgi:hypothetical protein